MALTRLRALTWLWLLEAAEIVTDMTLAFVEEVIINDVVVVIEVLAAAVEVLDVAGVTPAELLRILAIAVVVGGGRGVGGVDGGGEEDGALTTVEEGGRLAAGVGAAGNAGK